jgi:hypothetical protein
MLHSTVGQVPEPELALRRLRALAMIGCVVDNPTPIDRDGFDNPNMTLCLCGAGLNIHRENLPTKTLQAAGIVHFTPDPLAGSFRAR